MDPGALIVVGAGPGIGESVARRFAREGHPVGLVARNRERLDRLASELRAGGADAAVAIADIRDVDAVDAAVRDLTEGLGPPEVLCVSPLPDVGLIKPVAETTAGELSDSLQLGVVGTAAAVGAVLPRMRKRGTGTMLFTTGSAVLNPNPDRASSGITNAAQTAYFKMLGQALAPDGIHVAHLVIVGPVGPGEKHEPDEVAEQQLWQRHVRRQDLLTVLD